MDHWSINKKTSDIEHNTKLHIKMQFSIRTRVVFKCYQFLRVISIIKQIPFKNTIEIGHKRH